MKNIKRLLAVLTVICLVFTFTACHKKGEAAVKVGDLTFSSGYYACAFFFADSEARSKVEEQLKADGEDTTDVDYAKHEIDGKKYADYVKEEALNSIKKIAAAKIYCKNNKLTLGDDEQQVELYAEYYWENGYSDVLIKNGVSKETYIEYMKDASYESAYFDNVFGSEGEKAVSEDALKEELSKNYALADMIDVDFTDLDDEEKTAKTEQLNTYLTELSKGKRSFEDIYHEYNGTEAGADETTESGDDSETAKPLDDHATLIGNSETSVANDYFDEIHAMENGSVKIIDKADDAGKILVLKKDVLADPYYLTNYDSTLRHAIADEDFEKVVEDFLKTLKFTEYTSATGAFTVKKVYYPETTS